jgi:hypothetical protein
VAVDVGSGEGELDVGGAIEVEATDAAAATVGTVGTGSSAERTDGAKEPSIAPGIESETDLVDVDLVDVGVEVPDVSCACLAGSAVQPTNIPSDPTITKPRRPIRTSTFTNLFAQRQQQGDSR